MQKMGLSSRWILCLWLVNFMAGTIIAVAGESGSSLSETGKAYALLNQVRLLDAESNTNTTDNESPTNDVVAPATNGTEGSSGGGNGNNEDPGGSSSAGAGDGGGNSQTDPPNKPAQPPDPTPPPSDVCSETATCQECVKASDKLDDKETHICVWDMLTGDNSVCQKKLKDDPGNPKGDMCSLSEPIPEVVASDDESNGTLKILGVVAVLIACGLYVKSKFLGGTSSTLSNGSPVGKATKYHEV